jgi:tetratricopeptide (TPR) repeat protein
MTKLKPSSPAAIILMVLVTTIGAEAQWSGIKPLLQKDVQIVAETKTRLVLYHQALGDSLVFTPTQEYDSDIYGGFEARRGGNPYRIWVATEKFLNNPRLAKDAGRKFFHESFLRALRQDEPTAQPAQLRFPHATERMEMTIAPDSGGTGVEKSGAKDSTSENVKTELATLDSLTRTGKKDSLQIAAHQPALPQAEKALETTPGTREARSEPAEVKRGQQSERNAGKTTPVKPRAEAAATAFSPTLVDSLYLAALAAMEKEEWRQAAFNLEKIRLLQPGYRDVVDLLARVRVNLISAEKSEGETGSQKSDGSNVFVGGAIATIGAFIALIVLPFIGVVLISPTTRARYHIFRGHYAEAVHIYEKLLVRRPNRKKLFAALAGLYLRLGRRDEAALKVYERVLQLNLAGSNRDEINSIVSHIYLTKGRTDPNVIEVLEDALKAERQKQKRGK